MDGTTKTQQHYYDFCEMLWNNFKCCDLPGTTQALATAAAAAATGSSSGSNTELITIEIYDKKETTTTTTTTTTTAAVAVAATVQLKLGDLVKWKKKHANTSGPSGASAAASASSSSSSSAQGASLFSLTASDVVDFIASSSAAKKAFKGRPAPSLAKYSVYVLKRMSDGSAKLHSKRFKKYLRSHSDADRPCCGRPDTYACIPLEPGAPFWLYTYTLGDTIAFVESQQQCSEDGDTGGNAEFDAQFVTLKLVVGEEGVAETLRVPAALPAGVLCRTVNEGAWWGPHHHAVEAKHLKYYGLFYLSISQGWVPLDPETQLAECGLLRNAIVAFKRKNVCELCYQCAVGPAAGLFESIKRVTNDYDGCTADENDNDNDNDNNSGATSNDSDGDDDNDGESSGSGSASASGSSSAAKARSNLKVLVSLDWTIKEATGLLQHWVADTFGLSLNDAEKENSKRKRIKKKIKKKNKEEEKKEHKRNKHITTAIGDGEEEDNNNEDNEHTGSDSTDSTPANVTHKTGKSDDICKSKPVKARCHNVA